MKRSVKVLLLKLADGGRIPRFYEPSSGFTRQKHRGQRVCAEMLDRELGAAA